AALHAKNGGRLSPSAARTVAPATLFVAQTEKYRASTIPWVRARATKRRQVSWLTGHRLMVGLPRHVVHGTAQWLPLLWTGEACPSRSPLTVAGTAVELNSNRLPGVFAPHSHIMPKGHRRDQRLVRKSTRLNSSHVKISYAVFC